MMEVSKGRPLCWKGAHVWFLTAGVGTFILAVFILQSSSSSHLSSVLSLSSSDSLRSIRAELAELKEEQRYQQAQIRSLRAMLGTVSCKVQNVGPTGGFCLSVEDPSATPGVNAVDER
jgi:septal ring factor EnvC (AmiA/AmiB activator)